MKKEVILFVFDVVVYFSDKSYSDFTVIAENDIEARKKSIKLSVENGANTLVIEYCDIKMIARLDG